MNHLEVEEQQTVRHWNGTTWTEVADVAATAMTMRTLVHRFRREHQDSNLRWRNLTDLQIP